MATNLTTIFGGNPSSNDSTQPASTINDRPEEGDDGATTQGVQEADDDGAFAASSADDGGASGPMGPPSGSPEPYDDGGF